MATHDGAPFLAEQIESLRWQTFDDWRLLVSDDCSGDGTLGVLRRYTALDSRVCLASEGVHFGGAKQNFMNLLLLSDAPYAMFCDQDDVWLQDKVEISLSKMRDLEARGGTGTPLLVFSDMAVVGEGLGVISPSFTHYNNIDPMRVSFAHVLAQSVGAGCTFMMNRALVEVSAKCVDVDNIVMHDWWVSLVAAAFGGIGYVHRPSQLYRQHGKNAVGANRYSPMLSLLKFGEMRKRFESTIAQGQVFYKTYGNEMSETQREVIGGFTSLSTTNGLQSVCNLIRSGCWKKGFRKVGQICVVVYGV